MYFEKKKHTTSYIIVNQWFCVIFYLYFLEQFYFRSRFVFSAKSILIKIKYCSWHGGKLTWPSWRASYVKYKWRHIFHWFSCGNILSINFRALSYSIKWCRKMQLIFDFFHEMMTSFTYFNYACWRLIRAFLEMHLNFPPSYLWICAKKWFIHEILNSHVYLLFIYFIFWTFARKSRAYM